MMMHSVFIEFAVEDPKIAVVCPLGSLATEHFAGKKFRSVIDGQ